MTTSDFRGTSGFESSNELIKDTFDIFLVTESKLDSSFS